MVLAATEGSRQSPGLEYESPPCGPRTMENAMRTRYPQLRLASVNMRMRRVVLSTSRFWTTISSHLSEGAIDVFLHRSGNATLNVKMISSDDFNGDEFEKFVEKMLAYSHRWASLVFVVNNSDFEEGIGAISSILSGTNKLVLPELTSLQVLYSNRMFDELREAWGTLDEVYPFPGYCQWTMPKLTHAFGYNNVPQIHNCESTMTSLSLAICDTEEFGSLRILSNQS